MSSSWLAKVPRHLLSRLVAVAVLSGVVTACDDPFSPYWDRGTYVLRSANNRAVPTVVSGGYGPNSPRTEVTAGTLTLRRDHSYQLLVEVREWDSAGRPYTSSVVFAGYYENEDRVLYLNYSLPGDRYSSTMIATWRGGSIEVVVPELDGYFGVLCVFDD